MQMADVKSSSRLAAAGASATGASAAPLVDMADVEIIQVVQPKKLSLRDYTNGVRALYFSDGTKMWEAEIDFQCGAGYVRIMTFTDGHRTRSGWPKHVDAGRVTGLVHCREERPEKEFVMRVTDADFCLYDEHLRRFAVAW